MFFTFVEKNFMQIDLGSYITNSVDKKFWKHII